MYLRVLFISNNFLFNNPKNHKTNINDKQFYVSWLIPGNRTQIKNKENKDGIQILYKKKINIIWKNS
jgi:hypothetical protein